MVHLTWLLLINDVRLDGGLAQKKSKKVGEKLVQGSHPKRMSGERVQVFVTDFPYFVGLSDKTTQL